MRLIESLKEEIRHIDMELGVKQGELKRKIEEGAILENDIADLIIDKTERIDAINLLRKQEDK